MKASDKIIAFLKQVEGFRGSAYLPLAGDKWTIGYGFTQVGGSPVQEGDTLSQSDADQILENLVNSFGEHLSVDGLENLITQNQFDAALSLSYNIGLSAFKNSSTGRMFYSGSNISERFLLWNEFEGKPNQGLTNRRIKEKRIYDNSQYT